MDPRTVDKRPASVVHGSPPRWRRIVLWLCAIFLALAGMWAAALFSAVPGLWLLPALASGGGLLVCLWCGRKLLRWRAMRWLPCYLRSARFHPVPGHPVDVCFLFVDHFEPEWQGADEAEQESRVVQWERAYRRAIRGHADSDGRPPRHTWFSTASLVSPRALAVLAGWPQLQWGEIEYHLHHGPQATDRDVLEQIRSSIALLREHGAVADGRYGLVHGQYALAGGDPTFCRLATELDILLETGCYADFTFPCLAARSQPRQVNSIYYAQSTGKPKPYDSGTPAAVGATGEGLLLIPGPMCLAPTHQFLDDAEVAPHCPPVPRRIPGWLNAHVHVRGRPNWVFISVHSHTAAPHIRDFLFTGPMQALWAALEARFKRPGHRLHYVTAREAYNIIKAAEAGFDGNPDSLRDFEIPPPAGLPGSRAALSAGVSENVS